MAVEDRPEKLRRSAETAANGFLAEPPLIVYEGASHDESVSAHIYGVRAGLEADLSLMRHMLLRRAPGRFPWTSGRREADEDITVLGLNNGITGGGRISVILPNRDIKAPSIDYSRTPRPSHADYPAVAKGCFAPGGGRFSGRMTAPMTAAGGLILGWLKKGGIRIYARVWAVLDITDDPFDMLLPDEDLLKTISGKDFPALSDERAAAMQKLIAETAGNSLGSAAEGYILGLKAGDGGMFEDGLESLLSSCLFAVPGVKAVEFGAGRELSRKTGQEANDELYFDSSGQIRTYTNQSGGINGGLSNGMPLVFRVYFRPAPTIALPQRTVDLRTGRDTVIEGAGRNDCALAPRAVPVIEAAAAIALSRVIPF